MKHRYIAALDQGTSSSRCLIFDKNCDTVSKSQEEFRQIFPRPGWVEHDPQDIFNTQINVFKNALKKANLTARDIAAVGITNQRETVIVWDKESGKPVHNAIVWQCRRTADMMERMSKDGFEDFIRFKTGLLLDAYFSASKIKWILDNVAGAKQAARKGKLLFGTVDTYLIWRLSGGKIHATDYTNASRTMLFNIHTLSWDDELLELFGIPRQILPQVYPSGYLMGYIDSEIMGAKIPIACAVGDQQAAMFGHLCVQKGDIKNTYGTGCFLLLNTGNEPIKSKSGLITTLLAGLTKKPDYALEGSVFTGGAVIQWLRDGLGLIKTSAQSQECAQKVNDTNGVYLVPAFTGLGAPYWDADARGVIVGITRGVQKEHIVRAALESIAYQSMDVLWACEQDLKASIKRLAVDGGACANDFLMQFQADIANVEVARPKNLESTALGAAYLAGLAVKYWQNIDEIKQNTEYDVFYPQIDNNKRQALIDGWKKAVQKSRS
ncbi:MAG TPA: glycerol kinase GlpK [Clostridiales bacterium]|nr:glycerol kinase GlpK [Clostridiales bacterium]